jgi:hypothetical protein
MAKFLNKKEQVYDLQLTSYGKYTLSIGEFKPAYYAFYDDNVIYDRAYSFVTSGSSDPFSQSVEPQNSIHKRIKEETPYLESLVLFEDVEQTTNNEGGYFFDLDITPTQETPRNDIFKFDAAIGDAYLSAESNQYTPAWKIIALESTISASNYHDKENDTKIPQLDIDARYTKKAIRGGYSPNSFTSSVELTPSFIDGHAVALERQDALFYAEEVNTALLTENFDIEVFEVVQGSPCTHASGSIQVRSQPEANDYIVINNSVDILVYMFKDTDTTDFGVYRYVTIGGSVAATAENLYDKIADNGPDITATYDSSTVVSLTNNIPCAVGNVALTSREDTEGTFHLIGLQGAENSKKELKRKYFQTEIPQVVDGLMMSARPETLLSGEITTGSVEYYFNIYTDQQIIESTACKAAEEFNKQSYYVDLDFDCAQESDDEIVYNDIYGRVTESEICPD